MQTPISLVKLVAEQLYTAGLQDPCCADLKISITNCMEWFERYNADCLYNYTKADFIHLAEQNNYTEQQKMELYNTAQFNMLEQG